MSAMSTPARLRPSDQMRVVDSRGSWKVEVLGHAVHQIAAQVGEQLGPRRRLLLAG